MGFLKSLEPGCAKPPSNSLVPAVMVLKQIQALLVADSTSAIITIIIEDYVTSPNGLTKVFHAAGLRPFWFPISRMPKNGGDWPIIDDMIKHKSAFSSFHFKIQEGSS